MSIPDAIQLSPCWSFEKKRFIHTWIVPHGLETGGDWRCVICDARKPAPPTKPARGGWHATPFVPRNQKKESP